tara:strand:+ start:175 stop:441 length:267 start_codon:yes stop_codon:yes gene_type:complete
MIIAILGLCLLIAIQIISIIYFVKVLNDNHVRTIDIIDSFEGYLNKSRKRDLTAHQAKLGDDSLNTILDEHYRNIDDKGDSAAIKGRD